MATHVIDRVEPEVRSAAVARPEEAKSGYETLNRPEEAEPWEPWETKLVLYSIGIGVVVLLIGGWLVNRFILSGH